VTEMGNFLKTLKFIWKYRKELLQFKDEILELKVAVEEAIKEGSEGGKKITKAEMVTVLKEVDDVLDLTIALMEE
jgi:hypothetical protein